MIENLITLLLIKKNLARKCKDLYLKPIKNLNQILVLILKQLNLFMNNYTTNLF
jgi:hypothetical protein